MPVRLQSLHLAYDQLNIRALPSQFIQQHAIRHATVKVAVIRGSHKAESNMLQAEYLCNGNKDSHIKYAVLTDSFCKHCVRCQSKLINILCCLPNSVGSVCKHKRPSLVKSEKPDVILMLERQEVTYNLSRLAKARKLLRLTGPSS